MENISKTDLHYITGFFDGEGYIGVGSQRRLEIRIKNTNREVLDFIQSKYGGYIYTCKRLPKRKQVWDFVILGESCWKMISDMYPILKVKREQTDRAIEVFRLLNPKTVQTSK